MRFKKLYILSFFTLYLIACDEFFPEEIASFSIECKHIKAGGLELVLQDQEG